MPAIGIDLGTTNSCVAVHRNGTTDVIINRRGNRTTPSCVSFTKTGRNIGEAGLEQMIRTPENTVVEVKRLIGRKFSEVADTKKLEHWPFVVISENDKPKICVEYRGEKKKFTAEEISAMILEEMKQIAEAFLEEKVEDAVITVPAYFNDSQRQATKDAARIAGLNVLRLINEPTAAAIAYGLNKKTDKPFKILTFDIGGGTFDVSILEVEGAKFTVKSTGGDTDLGGADFDSRLIDHCVKMFKRDHGVDLTDNRRAMMRLRFACEKTKKALSNSEQADLIVDALHDGEDLDTTICRAYFDQLNLDLFERTLETTKRTIKDAGLTKNQIDHVVLVGGSTRIVKVQKMLQEYFEGKDLKHSINPDEAVACGAAMLAASLSGDKSGPVSDIKLLDVNPLSLGVAEGGTNMQNIIDRNTTLPTKNTRMFTNASDNQSCALVQIFEGERPRAQDNHKLGELELNLIERGPRGFSKLEVTFALDVNGILKVFAVETATGQSKSITIKGTNRLSDLEIQKMISEAKMYEKEDRRYREQAAARNQLTDYVYSLKHSLENDKAKTVCWNKAKEAFLEMCLDTISWLEENTDAEKEEYLSKTNKLKIQSGLTSTEQ